VPQVFQRVQARAARPDQPLQLEHHRARIWRRLRGQDLELADRAEDWRAVQVAHMYARRQVGARSGMTLNGGPMRKMKNPYNSTSRTGTAAVTSKTSGSASMPGISVRQRPETLRKRVILSALPWRRMAEGSVAPIQRLFRAFVR